MSFSVLKRENAPDLAYARSEGASPCVLFLGGFRSSMTGTKATFLESACRARGQAYVRFDYSAHGSSGGDIRDGTVGSWARDSLDVLDKLTQGPVVLVGSSMGGWIALLLALQRPERVKAIVGLAAAPDFTKVMEARMSASQRAALEKDGFFELPNDYDPQPYVVTKALLDDGRENALLPGPIAVSCPVRLIQGMKDPDVEWQHAHRIKNALASRDAEVLLVEDGDHRLSRPQDLALLDRAVQDLSA